MFCFISKFFCIFLHYIFKPIMKEERQRTILDKINKDQRINLLDLSQLMQVSYDSIRRDVIELEDKGFLKKVHGGAVANSYLSFKAAQGLGVANQEVIQLTKKVHKLIENKRIILMDGGTTNFHIAEQLPKHLAITIITNSLPLATVLNEHEKIETILLGGAYFQRYQITLGGETIRQVEQFRPDLYLMGFNGIDPKCGLTIRHYEESILKQKMMRVSNEVAVCSIQEKFTTIENYKVCDIHEIDTLVTSLKSNDELLEPFKTTKVRIF